MKLLILASTFLASTYVHRAHAERNPLAKPSLSANLGLGAGGYAGGFQDTYLNATYRLPIGETVSLGATATFDVSPKLGPAIAAHHAFNHRWSFFEELSLPMGRQKVEGDTVASTTYGFLVNPILRAGFERVSDTGSVFQIGAYYRNSLFKTDCTTNSAEGETSCDEEGGVWPAGIGITIGVGKRF